jgi:hypothetical protein
MSNSSPIITINSIRAQFWSLKRPIPTATRRAAFAKPNATINKKMRACTVDKHASSPSPEEYWDFHKDSNPLRCTINKEKDGENGYYACGTFL